MNVVIALVMWPSWMLMSPICLLRYQPLLQTLVLIPPKVYHMHLADASSKRKKPRNCLSAELRCIQKNRYRQPVAKLIRCWPRMQSPAPATASGQLPLLIPEHGKVTCSSHFPQRQIPV